MVSITLLLISQVTPAPHRISGVPSESLNTYIIGQNMLLVTLQMIACVHSHRPMSLTSKVDCSSALLIFGRHLLIIHKKGEC